MHPIGTLIYSYDYTKTAQCLLYVPTVSSLRDLDFVLRQTVHKLTSGMWDNIIVKEFFVTRYCTKCGANISDKFNYCERCGYSIRRDGTYDPNRKYSLLDKLKRLFTR